jgi:ABC-type transport system involved in cytochrome c biogenesis permease subunit
MNWIYFPIYALLAAIFWIVGATMMFFAHRKPVIKYMSHLFILLGIGTLSVFILLLWHTLDRPPMRTLGETRLWYAALLPVLGYTVFLRRGSLLIYKLLLIISILLAILFLWINYSNPEAHEKTLMPALQSPWFIPHVIVYILSYVVLGLSSVVAVAGLFLMLLKKYERSIIRLADNLVYVGFSLLTLGMLFGALWAKEAWGHYWTWDPKETWAFLTWLGYLIYIHLRHYRPSKAKGHLWMLSLAFVVLLVCWFGINYLPSAQNSVHIYAR